MVKDEPKTPEQQRCADLCWDEARAAQPKGYHKENCPIHKEK